MFSSEIRRFLRRAAVFSLSAVMLGGTAVGTLPDITDASVSVSAAAAVTGISLDKTSLSLGKGESFTLKAAVSPSNAGNKTVSWSTSNGKVVTVSGGKLKAVGTGTATVTAKTSNGKTAKCTVNVKAEPSKVTISKTTLSLGVGESFTLSAAVPDGSAAAVRTFRTSNSSIVKMTKTNWTGSFTAVKTGVAWVTVRLYNGKEASCKITVKNAPSSVKLSRGLLNLKVGETYSVSSTVNDGSAAAKRTYRTSNSKVVQMTKTDWTGAFKAVGVGTAYVTVRIYNGKEATCKVIVTDIPVTSVKLNKTSADMKVGQSMTLSATVAPSNATNKSVIWTSSNRAVATVENGKVTAKGAGTATITAKSNNGKTAVCTLKVKKVTGFTKLQDKLAVSYDQKDSDGNTSITYTNGKQGSQGWLSIEIPPEADGLESVSIKSNNSNDTVELMYMFSPKTGEGVYMVAMALDFNSTYNMEPYFGWICNQEMYNAEAVTLATKINAKTYKKNSALVFSPYMMEDVQCDQATMTKAIEVAPEQFARALSKFDELLYSKYKWHLKDIGFDSYE